MCDQKKISQRPKTTFMETLQEDRESLNQIDDCVEVKAEEINRGNNINQQSKRLCLFFQYCLYTHWKSAHNRSIVLVIIDTVSSSLTALWLKGMWDFKHRDDNRKNKIWPTNKVGLQEILDTSKLVLLENPSLQNTQADKDKKAWQASL